MRVSVLAWRWDGMGWDGMGWDDMSEVTGIGPCLVQWLWWWQRCHTRIDIVFVGSLLPCSVIISIRVARGGSEVDVARRWGVCIFGEKGFHVTCTVIFALLTARRVVSVPSVRT